MKVTASIVRTLLYICIVLLQTQCNSSSAEQKIASADKDEYSCLPCGRDCDNELYNAPGNCPHCQMELVKRSTITFKTIQPAELCQYIATHPNSILLDVRTKEEFEGKANPDFGSLKHAINLPIQLLNTEIASLEKYKGKEIIVYCSHSHRSPQASYILTQNGFKHVINMAGGMSVLTDNSCRK